MEIACFTCGESFKKRKRQKEGFSFCSRHCYSKQKIKVLYCKTCNAPIDRRKKYCSRSFCNPCYRKDYNKRHPEKVEKNRKYITDKVRIKRGLPLDHPRLIAKPGEGHKWKNGYRCIYKPGYHGRKNKSGRLLEHIWVMTQHLGRNLFKGENIHHKNGIRDDNRLDNLELWNTSQPSGQRVDDKISFYKEFLEQYGYDVIKKGDS